MLVAHEKKYFGPADQTALTRYTGVQIFISTAAPPQEVESIPCVRGKAGYGWQKEPDLLLQVEAVDPHWCGAKRCG